MAAYPVNIETHYMFGVPHETPDDTLETIRVAPMIPRPFGVDDGDRTTFANPKTVRLGPIDAALLGQFQLLESALEIIPCFERPLAVAALRIGLVAAEEDMPPRDANAHGFGHSP